MSIAIKSFGIYLKKEPLSLRKSLDLLDEKAKFQNMEFSIQEKEKEISGKLNEYRDVNQKIRAIRKEHARVLSELVEKELSKLEMEKARFVVGFSEEEPEYGYEFWIKVDDSYKSDDVVEVKSFPGGLYAVTTTPLMPLNPDNVIPAWPKLVEWVESSKYQISKHQWLEKSLNPSSSIEEVVLDLYLPITSEK